MPSVDEWIANESIPFELDSPPLVDDAIDRMMRGLDASVDLLGFAAALHGSDEVLVLRNRVFQRLVEAHGYNAFVVEVTSRQARAINDYGLGLPSSMQESAYPSTKPKTW